MRGSYIMTDNEWYNFDYGFELTEEEKKDFDWVEDIDVEKFARFRDRLYALSEFMIIPVHININIKYLEVNGEKIKAQETWDGYADDTAFSSIVIKLDEDGESYKIGIMFGVEEEEGENV